MGRQLWLADTARAAGLKVIEVQGWRERGSATFQPRGLVLHHTAGAATGDMPSLPIIVSGRRDLPGPLAQFGLGRSGIVYVVASGRASHAGDGGWRGLAGNASVFGIEAENTGLGQAWPAVQIDAYHRLAAAIAARTPFGPSMICGHREWTPRKIDPAGIDLDVFRARVAGLLKAQPTKPPTPAPLEDDMLIAGDGFSAWLIIGGTRFHVESPEELARLKAAGIKYVEAPALVKRIPVAS